MAATITLRTYTGSGAATESAPQTDIDLCADDALTGDPVQPGSVSFERWLRLRVDAAPVQGVANFWLMNTGDLPDGVSLLFGITDTPATPVDTVSQVATKVLASGRKFVFDASTLSAVGDHSRYVVIQEVVAGDADSGAIDDQALAFGWVER